MRPLMVSGAADLMSAGLPAYLKETDPLLVKEAMPANLKMIEAMLESDPCNETMLFMACQGFASYAFLFVEADDPVRARRLYERAKNYGFKLLSEKGLLPDNPLDLDAWDRRLSRADISDVPALFWTAFAWGSRIQTDRESPEALADMPHVIKIVERVRALDPGYWFAGPDTFLGFYHASIPVALGGRPDLARKHFEQAIQATGGKYTMIYFLYARSYAVQVQDKQLFEQLLEKAASPPGDAPDTAALANVIAADRAKRLQQKEEDFFP